MHVSFNRTIKIIQKHIIFLTNRALYVDQPSLFVLVSNKEVSFYKPRSLMSNAVVTFINNSYNNNNKTSAS